MKKDSTREKIWTLLQKLAFQVIEKEKTSWMFSWTCSLLKMDGSSDHSLETFIKYRLKTTVIEDRLDQWFWNGFSTAAKFTFNFSFQIKIFKNTAFVHVAQMLINILEQNSLGTKKSSQSPIRFLNSLGNHSTNTAYQKLSDKGPCCS